MTKSSDAPKVNSARKPPQNSFLFNKRAEPQAQQENKPKQGVDPRWNAHVYHGNAVKQNVEAQYSFLKDIAAEDQKKRLARLKILMKERRIRQREEREREMAEIKKSMKNNNNSNKKNQKNKNKKNGADENDDDDAVGFENENEDEDEEEEEEEDDFHEGLDEEERIKIGLMRDSEIDQEILKLKKGVNSFKMKEGERKAEKKKSDVRKNWAKAQMNAVKTGKQKQAFFLNDKKMKIAQVREEFKEAKKQGVQAANSFVERRMKKRFDAKHLRR